MKTLAVIPSIRDTGNIKKYVDNFAANNQEVDILKINESTLSINALPINDSIYQYEIGVDKRKQWFKENLPNFNVDDIIPQKAHNENSFGLLYALKQKEYNMILFLDDDTYPANDKVDFIGEHWRALNDFGIPAYKHDSKWLNTHTSHFARGYPTALRLGGSRFYSLRCHKIDAYAANTVLNMGFWKGVPDLNAIDYLTYHPQREPELNLAPFSLAPDNYAPICSMNVAFKPEIIPAFYQLWFKDRYDDIFSGLFLEKIAHHLGKSITFSYPYCYHDKVTRNLYDDIRTELTGMEINETLYIKLDFIELTKNTWIECYRELAEGILTIYREDQRLGDLMAVTAGKMILWTDICKELMS